MMAMTFANIKYANTTIDRVINYYLNFDSTLCWLSFIMSPAFHAYPKSRSFKYKASFFIDKTLLAYSLVINHCTKNIYF